jgi:hypothetical protein
MVKVDEYARIRQAHRIDKLSVRQLARRFHHSRRKIRDILARPELKKYQRRPMPSVVDPFKPVIDAIVRADADALPARPRTRPSGPDGDDRPALRSRDGQRLVTPRAALPSLSRSDRQLDRFLEQLQRTDVLICDELGYLSFSRVGAELLFQVFADRYERKSLLITSNLPFGDWVQVFQGERMTAALLDRLDGVRVGRLPALCP